MFEVATLTEAYLKRGQDRVDCIKHPDGVVIVVADGAGGTSGGADAAETLVMWARAHVTRVKSVRGGEQWREFLLNADRQISCAEGQTTGVVVAMFDGGLAGASVGDSAAWLVRETTFDDLTRDQIRKPLLGTGSAVPVAFERSDIEGCTLLLGSDGLVKYAPWNKICDVVRGTDLHVSARELINLVRLKSGNLPDDVAVALCRKNGQQGIQVVHSPKKRYTITESGDTIEEVIEE